MAESQAPSKSAKMTAVPSASVLQKEAATGLQPKKETPAISAKQKMTPVQKSGPSTTSVKQAVEKPPTRSSSPLPPPVAPAGKSGLKVQTQQSRNKTSTDKSFADLAKSGLTQAKDPGSPAPLPVKAAPPVKSAAIKPALESPVPPKTALQAKKVPKKKMAVAKSSPKAETEKAAVKKPATKAIAKEPAKPEKKKAQAKTPTKVPAPPTKTAMKKPAKTMPETTKMAVKKAPAQPKAGKAPTAPAPPAPTATKKSTFTAKKTAGKTGQVGIIFVSKDPRMNKTHRLQAGGQQVTIVVKGENLDRIKSAQVLDMNNRPVASSIVKVVRLQCDKPTELKVTLQAVSMPKAGGNCKLRLKAGKKSVETPVRLEVIAAKTKKMEEKSTAPIQKKR
jgi:hypothetical protein